MTCEKHSYRKPGKQTCAGCEVERLQAENDDLFKSREALVREKFNLLAEALDQRRQLAEYEALIAQQHSRTVEADKLWQAAHGKPGVYPDLGELIGWLMRERVDLRRSIDNMQRVIDGLNETIKAQDTMLNAGDRPGIDG